MHVWCKYRIPMNSYHQYFVIWVNLNLNDAWYEQAVCNRLSDSPQTAKVKLSWLGLHGVEIAERPGGIFLHIVGATPLWRQLSNKQRVTSILLHFLYGVFPVVCSYQTCPGHSARLHTHKVPIFGGGVFRKFIFPGGRAKELPTMGCLGCVVGAGLGDLVFRVRKMTPDRVLGQSPWPATKEYRHICHILPV